MNIIWQTFNYLDEAIDHSTWTEVIKEIRNQGHAIRYYCTYKKIKKYYNLTEAEIKYVAVPKIRIVRALVYFFKMTCLNIGWVFYKSPDIIISDNYMIFPSLTAVLINKILHKRIKYILDIRSVPVEIKDKCRSIVIENNFKLSLKISFIMYHGISFITPFMEKYLRSKYQTALPAVTWSSGINQDLFDPASCVLHEHDYFELFHHGSLTVNRGIRELMQAAKLLNENGFNIRLKLIGTMIDKMALETFYHENKMEGYCAIYPAIPIEQIPQHIMDSDLPVLPFSDFIGWRVSSPIKLFEYLSMGKVVVATKIEAFTDIFINQDFVYYADSDKAHDLIKAIKRAYLDKASFKTRGIKAREFTLKHFTWEQQADKLMGFIKSIK